jgi:hypothetical protein
MATKASASKKPVKRAAAKTTARKAPVKRTAAKRTTKKASAAEMRSFRIYKDSIPFTRAQVTRQTVYWVILMGVIVAMQLWIIKLQLEIAQLTDLLLIP